VDPLGMVAARLLRNGITLLVLMLCPPKQREGTDDDKRRVLWLMAVDQQDKFWPSTQRIIVARRLDDGRNAFEFGLFDNYHYYRTSHRVVLPTVEFHQ